MIPVRRNVTPSALEAIRTKPRWQGVLITAQLRRTHSVTEIAAKIGRPELRVEQMIRALNKLEGDA